MIVNEKRRTVLLTADEVATAIDAYLVAHNVCVDGPRTISLAQDDRDDRERLCVPALVVVDPSGKLVDNR